MSCSRVWVGVGTSRSFSTLARTPPLPLDAQRIGIDYGLFENEVSTLGVGGASVNFVESAYLAFSSDDALYAHEIALHVCKPAEELMTIPSLLGRDVIDQWRVTYDKSALELLAEVISWDARESLED